MQIISLFSGIGGFELAGRWLGWDSVVSCEINDFARKVLQYHFPESYLHGDIRSLTYEKVKEKSRWQEELPTILVGGFPCQPFSTAGKRKGQNDDRHLWPEMLRVVEEIKPDWVVGENVAGILSMEIDKSISKVESQINIGGCETYRTVETERIAYRICKDFEEKGYEVQTFVIPACGVNAPHRRDRVWFTAYRSNARSERMQRSKIRSCRFRLVANSIKIGTWMEEQNPSNQERNAPNIFKRKMVRQGDRSVDAKRTSKPRSSKSTSNTNERFCQQQTKELQSKWITFDISSEESFTDSDYEGLERWGFSFKNTEKDRRGQESTHGMFRQLYKLSSWQNFPTQPPICGRDDGIPRKLDAITFSKWRTESIKAYGNAIVPQVAYEIFKPIAKIQSEL